jgi:hypothetical protein
MPIRDSLRRVGKALRADVEEDASGTLWLEMVLARRQACVLLKRLRYRIGLESDEASRTVFFQEWLWEDEAHPGIDVAARFAEKEQAYRVSGADAPGNIEHVALLFAKRYGAGFDFPQVRNRLRQACEADGYSLRHLIPL